MSHEFESGFFGGRQPAWHGLGTVIDADVVTAAEAITLAGLDWRVEKVPVYQAGDDGPEVIPGRYGVRRDTDGRILGIVGGYWQPVQNRDAFAFCDEIVVGGGAKYHTAGSLYGGEKVWALARLDRGSRIGGLDSERIDNYLLLSNSHDGGGALVAAVTPVRVVCANTLTMALNGAARTAKLRHTTNIADRLHEAKRILGVANDHLDAFEAEAERMIATRVSDLDVRRFLDGLVPLPLDKDPDKDRTARNAQEARDAIVALFRNADNLGNVRGTAWGLYNAAVEWADWGRRVNSTSRASGPEQRFARATGVNNGVGDRTKQKALALLS